MRTRAGIHHRVALLKGQLARIIPAAAQIVTMEIVRGVGHPFRHEVTVVFIEVDGDHLPIGFVVIDTAESRAPVVVTIEEPVLEHRPMILSDYTPVVGESLTLGTHMEVVQLGGGCAGCRHASAHEERKAEERVHDTRQQAAACQPPQARVKCVLQVAAQPELLGQDIRRFGEAQVLDESQIVDRPEVGRPGVHQAVDRQIILPDQQFIAPVGVVRPKTALLPRSAPRPWERTAPPVCNG